VKLVVVVVELENFVHSVDYFVDDFYYSIKQILKTISYFYVFFFITYDDICSDCVDEFISLSNKFCPRFTDVVR